MKRLANELKETRVLFSVSQSFVIAWQFSLSFSVRFEKENSGHQTKKILKQRDKLFDKLCVSCFTVSEKLTLETLR